jgi:predicted Zn finger-like uncharacterized protein
MYVQCERCKTEYDFDDALVSERGTTVKCTQCAHQFKVRRAETGADRWVVTTVSGKSLVFTSLRELQKAILGKQVGRGDSLARGTAPPRILGSIAELEPFFEGKRTSITNEAGVPMRSSSRPPPPPGPTAPPLAPPKRGRVDTLRPPPEGSGAIPPPAPLAPPPAAPRDVSPFASTISASAALANTPAIPPAAPVPQAPATTVDLTPPVMEAPPPDPPTQPIMHDAPSERVRLPPRQPSSPPDVSSPLPPVARQRQDSLIEARASYPEVAAPRRPIGGWIVAAFLFVGVCVLGFVVARPYLMAQPAKTTAELPPLDPKAQKLVDDADRALADGDLDAAKENADKASVLADKDPRVLLIVSRVANARADQAWLRVALLPPNAGEPLTLAKKDRDDLANKARGAAEQASAAAPDDPAITRAKIDALRLAGDVTGARALVAKINAIAAQPETSYVLAALDLAEPAAPTAQVLARLREAADAERGLGRARAALVFALARSGDPAAARKEIERLLTLPRPYPLLQPLREFVDRTTAPVAPTGDGGAVAVVDVGNLPPTSGTVGAGAGSSDPRVLLSQAETAKGKGDYEKAKTLYGKVIEQNPGDSEALAGLGQIAYAQHDLANAQAYFRRAVSANGSYVPALVGLGDALWDSGDKAGAQKTYKDIVDRFPDAAYPGYVKQRAESGGGTTAPPPTATATATSSDNGGNP